MKKITLFLLLQFSVLSFAQSLDTTFNPADVGFGKGDGFDGGVNAIATQSDGKIIAGGSFVTYEGVKRGHIARLNEDGSLDAGFNVGSGASGTIYSTAIQSDGKIIIGGGFSSYNGVSRKSIARLNSDGSLDTGFNPGTGANSFVRSITVQSDGKIIIAGSFTSFNGVTINRIARLNTDGSLDTGFDPGIGASGGTNSPTVYSVSIQSDGKIIVGGYFSAYNGISRAGIVRLNTDGSMDTAFTGIGTGNGNVPNSVYSSLIQSDGKILIGGAFGSYNGIARRNIARLNADGSLDTGFIFGPGTFGPVNALALQSDGKIIIGGEYGSVRVDTNGTLDSGFSSSGMTVVSDSIKTIAVKANGKIIVGGTISSYQGSVRKGMVELNANGSINLAFGFANNGANGIVYTTSIQSDGKIIIGGSFSGYNDEIRSSVARLNKNGSLDTSFNITPGLTGEIYSTAIQPDGKIIIGGSFTAYNDDYNVANLARLNTDGSLDITFVVVTDDNYFDGSVNCVLLQPDGKIIIAGSFTSYRGIERNGIARINTDGTLDTDFDPGMGILQNESISSLGLQQNGKIIIGGYFSFFNDVSVNNIARLNSDGSLDATFDSGTGLNYGVDAMCLQTDGKIIIGGIFSSYNDIDRGKIARVNVDGSLDTDFNPPSGEDSSQLNEIRTLALQPNGKIIIGGEFSAYGDVARNGIARINTDGSLDTGFDPGTGLNNISTTICIQSDGGIIVGGSFTAYNGIGRNRIARINGIDVSNPGPIAAQQTFCAGATIANLAAEGSDVKWYNVALGGNPLPLSMVLVNTNYYFSQTVNGIESIRTTVPVLIVPNAVAGSISGAGTICSGSSKTLTLSTAHVGTVQWQSSVISNTTGFSNIEGATANTYQVSALTTTTYYKAIVTSGDCSSVATLPVTMVVTPSVAVAGYITSSDEDGYVCKYVAATSAGGVEVTNSTRLTLKDNAGLISWYRSTNGGTTWYTIAGQTTTSLDVNNLIGTTMFRAKSSTSGACYSYKYSEPVTINVYPAAVAGVLTADSNGYANVSRVCAGNDITFTSTRQIGSIEWQTSTESSTGPWTTVGKNSPTYKMANVRGINNSKIYVQTITTGACSFNPKPSTVKTITVTGVSVPGTLSGGKAVCSLGGGTLTLTGAVGTIQWMYSTDEGATYSNVVTGNNIAFTTASTGKSTTLIVTGVTATTHFRATVTNSNCSSLYSNVQVFTVGGAAVAGIIDGAPNVCYGTGTTLILRDAVGTIQWEKATYNQITNTYGTWVPFSGKTSATLPTGNLSSSYGYRAAVTVCTSVPTAIHNVIVDKAVAKSITANVTVPSGTSAATTGKYMPLPADFGIAKILTVSPGSWGSVSWERSLDGNIYTSIPGASGAQYTINEAASSSAGTLNYYRARFTTSCSPEVTSSPVMLYYKGAGVIAKFEGTKSVVANVAKSALTVTAYPNPYSASFKLNIITSSSAKVGIMVYDVLGKLLEQREVRPSDVSELNIGNNYPSGIYNLILTQEMETKSLHLIKQ